MIFVHGSLSEGRIRTPPNWPATSRCRELTALLVSILCDSQQFRVTDSPDLSGLLHAAKFRHAPAEVAPLHGIRAKAQCSLVGGQCFFVPPQPAQQVRPRGVVQLIRIEIGGCRDLLNQL